MEICYSPSKYSSKDLKYIIWNLYPGHWLIAVSHNSSFVKFGRLDKDTPKCATVNTVKTRPLINPVNAVIFPYLTTDDTLLTTYFFAVGNKFLSHFSDLQYCVTIVHSSVCTTINYISRNREEGDIAAHELRDFLMSSFNLVLIDHIKYWPWPSSNGQYLFAFPSIKNLLKLPRC